MPLNPYENESDRTRHRGRPVGGLDPRIIEQYLQWAMLDPGNRRFNRDMERKRIGRVREQRMRERMAQKQRLYGGGG